MPQKAPFIVGLGPSDATRACERVPLAVPRSARETALGGVRFSRGSNDRGGQAPALRYARPPLFIVGRGTGPRRASVETGNGLGRRAVFAQVERSRGTGPRATVCQAAFFHRRARACPSPCLGQNGKRPWTAGGFRAGRAIAGDRPPRYGMPGRRLSP